MGFLLGIVKWLFSDIRNIIIVILGGGLIVFYIGWRWEKMEADKYQKKAIEYEAAFTEQKAQTALCEKNKLEILKSCDDRSKDCQGTLGSCEKFLRICEKKKGGDCFDKDIIEELRLITIRFNDGMSGKTTVPSH